MPELAAVSRQFAVTKKTRGVAALLFRWQPNTANCQLDTAN